MKMFKKIYCTDLNQYFRHVRVWKRLISISSPQKTNFFLDESMDQHTKTQENAPKTCSFDSLTQIIGNLPYLCLSPGHLDISPTKFQVGYAFLAYFAIKCKSCKNYKVAILQLLSKFLHYCEI